LVRIGKVKYSIRKADLRRHNLKGYLARNTPTHKCKDEIVISSDQDIYDIESTLIHELLHGIDLWGLSEKQVLRLEKRLVELFRKNKWKILT
jgi:hypothetical protein